MRSTRLRIMGIAVLVVLICTGLFFWIGYQLTSDNMSRQIKNDYSAEWVITGKNNIVIDRGTGLFNGDMGVIKKIDNSLEEVTVEFDERKEVRIPFSGMEDLDLAYATTIHKSQGSEYPAVVIPLLGGPPVLLNRNLLYTAVTRAKKCVVILGNRETVVRMVENAEEMKRYTGLVKRLEEL